MDLLPIVSAIIVALGLVVAFLQWRTAQQKAALELKDRQLKLYEIVKNCVDQFGINSQRFDSELERKFLKAIEEAHFYFDDHLHDYLETLRKAILRVRDIEKEVARRQQQGKPTRPSPELAAEREQAMGRIHNFYEVAQAKFSNSRPRSWVRKLVAWQRRGPTHAP
jgi:hypothetical protein